MMNNVDLDLVSLSLCMVEAYGSDTEVRSTRSELTSVAPDKEPTWQRLEVTLANGPISEVFRISRVKRVDAGRTSSKDHLCMSHEGIDFVNEDRGADVMVAMCRWKNDNVKQHPETWAFFEPHHSQCQARHVKGSLRFTAFELCQWWLRWGLRWPEPDLNELHHV